MCPKKSKKFENKFNRWHNYYVQNVFFQKKSYMNALFSIFYIISYFNGKQLQNVAHRVPILKHASWSFRANFDGVSLIGEIVAFGKCVDRGARFQKHQLHQLKVINKKWIEVQWISTPTTNHVRWALQRITWSRVRLNCRSQKLNSLNVINRKNSKNKLT